MRKVIVSIVVAFLEIPATCLSNPRELAAIHITGGQESLTMFFDRLHDMLVDRALSGRDSFLPPIQGSTTIESKCATVLDVPPLRRGALDISTCAKSKGGVPRQPPSAPRGPNPFSSPSPPDLRRALAVVTAASSAAAEAMVDGNTQLEVMMADAPSEGYRGDVKSQHVMLVEPC